MPEPLRLPDATGSADSGGVRIAWWSAGTGDRTLLVVPTWNFVDSRVTADLVNDLSDEFRVVWFDARGSGQSDRRTAAGYTTFDHAADVMAVVESAGIGRMTMAAGSSGCSAMVLAARRLGERVDGLVFLGQSVDLDVTPATVEAPDRFFGPAPPDPEGFEWFNAEIFRRDWSGFRQWFFEVCFNEPGSQPTRDSVFAIAADADVEVLIQQQLDDAGTPHAEVVVSAIAGLTVPALVIHGSNDLIVPVEAAHQLAAMLPAGRLAVVEGGGHRPDVRSPELVNPLVRAFVAGRPLPDVPMVTMFLSPAEIRTRIPASSQSEDERQRFVHRPNLVRVEAAGGPTQAHRVDDRCLLDENSRLLGTNGDQRAERRRSGTARGRRHEHGAQFEVFVCLHDDRVPRAPLLVSSRVARRRQPEDLAPDHQSARRCGASAASCSRMTRISSRSSSSAASRRTSSRVADRARRRAAASRSATRTASESLRPSARMTSRAASEPSSSRTWSERAMK